MRDVTHGWWRPVSIVLLIATVGIGAVQRPAKSGALDLGGTSWQLVKFASSDGKALVPDDRTKYTIGFAADGSLAARIDCNRGRGTWKSPAPNQLQLGPLALTRAVCPPGSLHDHIVKRWSSIRTYVVKDGHLFLSLAGDGGVRAGTAGQGSFAVGLRLEPAHAMTAVSPEADITWVWCPQISSMAASS